MSGTALAMAKVVSQLAAVVSVRPLPRRRWGKISAATWQAGRGAKQVVVSQTTAVGRCMWLMWMIESA